MKSFRTLKSKYGDVERVEIANGVKLKNRYVATKLEGSKDWTLTQAKRIPPYLERFANQNGRAFSRRMLGNEKRETEALAQILPCRIVGILDTAPFVKEDDDKIYFEDVLICQPVKSAYSELMIYVRQSKAGAFQPEDLREMIGQLVAVKIVDLRQVRFEKRVNQFKTTDSSELQNEYVAIGDIDIAEYLLNAQVLKELEDADINERQNDPIYDKRTGIINHVTNNGLFILSQNSERVFIQNKHLSYKYMSPIFDMRDVYKVGDKIDFRFYRGEFRQPSPEKKLLGISGAIPIVTGERLSLEENPIDVIKRVIDSGRGTVVSGYISNYNEIKGHLFEVEGAYGYPIRLVPSEQIDERMFRMKQKISVVILSGTYEYAKDSRGEKYLRVRGKCTYNSSYTTNSDLEDFFD